jgi:hypothetical protein
VERKGPYINYNSGIPQDLLFIGSSTILCIVPKLGSIAKISYLISKN